MGVSRQLAALTGTTDHLTHMNEVIGVYFTRKQQVVRHSPTLLSYSIRRPYWPFFDARAAAASDGENISADAAAARV
jgi:hypothetical protein